MRLPTQEHPVFITENPVIIEVIKFFEQISVVYSSPQNKRRAGNKRRAWQIWQKE